MCEDLALRARRYCRGIVHVLKDVSLIAETSPDHSEDLSRDLGMEGPLLMYVGNLEGYQGIDLLLECFAKVLETHPDTELVIIGGSEADVHKYKKITRVLEIDARVHLIGPRPLAALGSYLRQADLLVSPRIQGTNTPMKIYSYLDSATAVVATAGPMLPSGMTRSVSPPAAMLPAASAPNTWTRAPFAETSV